MDEWYIGNCKTEQEKIDKIIQCLTDYVVEARDVLSKGDYIYKENLQKTCIVYITIILVLNNHTLSLSDYDIDFAINWLDESLNDMCEFVKDAITYEKYEVEDVIEIFDFCLKYIQKFKTENGKKEG